MNAALTAPASPAVMASAKALLAAGGLTETNREGVYRAQSSNGGSYLCSAQGLCECEAANRGNACKHVEACKLAVCEQVRAQAKARGIVVLRGASGAELLGDDEETDLYGPAEHCGLDECDCEDHEGE